MTMRCIARGAAGFGLVAALMASAVAHAQTTIKVDGSSTVYPITEAVAEEFNATHPNVHVPVGVSGTGGGFKKFVRGEIDVCDASRPIQVKEMEEAKKNGIEYLELPVAFDALTVMVNPKNTWVDQFTVAELKKIWEPDAQGKITRWNQVRPTWPDSPMKLYGAGSDSGTFDYFTEAVCGKSKASRGDFTASEDDNTLVKGIENDQNSLGYFGYAYYAPNASKLKAVPIVNAMGKPTLPSEKTVMDGSYNPLSRPLFIYINKKSLEKAQVRQFVEFYLKNAPALVSEVKYVPLPANAYEAAQSRLAKGETGTAFGGHNETGLHIDELMKRPLSTQPRAEKKEGGGK